MSRWGECESCENVLVAAATGPGGGGDHRLPLSSPSNNRPSFPLRILERRPHLPVVKIAAKALLRFFPQLFLLHFLNRGYFFLRGTCAPGWSLGFGWAVPGWLLGCGIRADIAGLVGGRTRRDMLNEPERDIGLRLFCGSIKWHTNVS